ncbi:MAG: hypothetical protein QM500_04105 [Methylococcales bacterium]
MAVVNRPVIGQVECFTQGCDESATVHMVEKGNRKGYLYTRCPECKCTQSTGKLFQNYLKENTDFRPEFEHLQVKKPESLEPEQPETIEGDQVNEPESEPTPETPQPKQKSGVWGVLLVVGAVAGLAMGLNR